MRHSHSSNNKGLQLWESLITIRKKIYLVFIQIYWATEWTLLFKIVTTECKRKEKENKNDKRQQNEVHNNFSNFRFSR